MNYAASIASGGVLYFVHADTSPLQHLFRILNKLLQMVMNWAGIGQDSIAIKLFYVLMPFLPALIRSFVMAAIKLYILRINYLKRLEVLKRRCS